MENLIVISKKLKPLVKSQAKDMKLLIVEDQLANIEFYNIVFGKYFDVCDVALDGQQALDLWNKDRSYYDLIVTDVDMPVMNGVELVRQIKSVELEQSIIVITATKDIEKNQDLAYHYIDGLLEKPLNQPKLFILLYRVLKKIAEKRDFNHYIHDLEKQVDDSTLVHHQFNFIRDKLAPLKKHKEVRDVMAMIETLISKTDASIEEKIHQHTVLSEKNVDSIENNKKPLGLSSVEKVLSADELCEELGHGIIDKIEDFLGMLDDYVVILDSMQSENASSSLDKLMEVSYYFNEFIRIINNLVIFPVVASAFSNLNTFINNIKKEDLEDLERKALLISLLLIIENDISNWIKNVFIQRTAENIYYFDASFANGIFEIESIFNTVEADGTPENFDDEELGFF